MNNLFSYRSRTDHVPEEGDRHGRRRGHGRTGYRRDTPDRWRAHRVNADDTHGNDRQDRRNGRRTLASRRRQRERERELNSQAEDELDSYIERDEARMLGDNTHESSRRTRRRQRNRNRNRHHHRHDRDNAQSVRMDAMDLNDGDSERSSAYRPRLFSRRDRRQRRNESDIEMQLNVPQNVPSEHRPFESLRNFNFSSGVRVQRVTTRDSLTRNGSHDAVPPSDPTEQSSEEEGSSIASQMEAFDQRVNSYQRLHPRVRNGSEPRTLRSPFSSNQPYHDETQRRRLQRRESSRHQSFGSAEVGGMNALNDYHNVRREIGDMRHYQTGGGSSQTGSTSYHNELSHFDEPHPRSSGRR